jgi:hypothetical protein
MRPGILAEPPQFKTREVYGGACRRTALVEVGLVGRISIWIERNA